MLITMDKCSEVKPILLRIVPSDRLSGLKKMLDLRFIEIRIALVDELVEELAAFPYAHNRLFKLLIFLLLLFCLL